MKIKRSLAGLLFWINFAFVLLAKAEDFPPPANALFLSGHLLRQGCIYKPHGDGPFPVMIYNQATSKPAIEHGDKLPFAALARLYNSRGYVFFLPGRRVADADEQKKVDEITDPNRRFMFAAEIHNADIEAAVQWLKSQTYVDERRIFMSGHSTGAIQSLLLAKKDLGILGIVAFSPAAKVWNDNLLLREALTDGVRNSRVPIFLIQPENDFSLAPSETLAGELARKGRPNRSKIYQSQGRSPSDGNAFAFTAPEIWNRDVFSFMDEILRKQPQ